MAKNEGKTNARSDTNVPKPKKTQNKETDPNYAAYQKWVKSKGFKQLKQLALERDGYRCQVTGRTIDELPEKCTLTAHHMSYKNCGKGDQSELNDIIILSSSAHRAIHSYKSHLRLFTDKSQVKENIEKYNPNMECRISSQI